METAFVQTTVDASAAVVPPAVVPSAAVAPSLLGRERSILEFNRRVLAPAQRADVPLLERLRYITIVSSNLDGFFEVRFADFAERDAPQREWVARFFESQVRPLLVPIGLDPAHPFPQVANKSLNFIVQLDGRDAFGRRNAIAIVKVPRVLPRVIRLPDALTGGRQGFVLLSSVIRAHLGSLFGGRTVVAFSQFRVTRDSELEVDDEEVTNLRQALRSGLTTRHFGKAIRLEVVTSCPPPLSAFLLQQFGLGEAARRGKEVTVVVELKARFDEEANINWAERLEAVGAQVVYGIVGLKTHAKLLLITRREGAGRSTAVLRRYAHLSTGNYNARIVVKCNALTDPTPIQALVRASQAGARIDLVVRGACMLAPGVQGTTANVRVRSIVGRFLEHSRVLSSPARRAQQTARELDRSFRSVDALAPDGSVAGLLDAARWHDSRVAVLVVGHQPTLGLVAAQLVGGLDPAATLPWRIKKGGVWWLRTRGNGDGGPPLTVLAVRSPDLL
jgi:polyphosphate kinase